MEIIKTEPDLIEVEVEVDRTLSNEDLIREKIGIAEIISRSVQYILIDTVPMIEGVGVETVRYVFFRIPEPTQSNVEAKRIELGLRRDFGAQAMCNILDADFQSKYPNADIWSVPRYGEVYAYWYLLPITINAFSLRMLAGQKFSGQVWFGGSRF